MVFVHGFQRRKINFLKIHLSNNISLFFNTILIYLRKYFVRCLSMQDFKCPSYFPYSFKLWYFSYDCLSSILIGCNVCKTTTTHRLYRFYQDHGPNLPYFESLATKIDFFIFLGNISEYCLYSWSLNLKDHFRGPPLRARPPR